MDMKLAKILESGLTGAATLTLLQETIDHLDPDAPRTHLLHKKGIIRDIKKGIRKKGFGAVKMYVKIAGELLGMAGYMGLAGIGKKKNALLRGGLLGALAGGAAAFMQDPKNEDPANPMAIWRKRAITLALYIIGGLMAGKAVQYFSKKKKK